MIKHPLFGFGVEFATEIRLLSFLLFAALVVVDDGDARFLGAL